MKVSSLVLAVFALLAVFGVSGSVTIKPTARKPVITTKPITSKPTIKKPVNSITTSKPKIDCSEPKKCTNIVQPVWASDGITCGVYRNKCYFSNANCGRWATNQKALKETSQQLCKPLCKKGCDNEINLQCGELNKEFKTFLNECDMNNYVCKTGETFLPTNIDNCGFKETISETENLEIDNSETEISETYL